jgi:hypothetical protein
MVGFSSTSLMDMRDQVVWNCQYSPNQPSLQLGWLWGSSKPCLTQSSGTASALFRIRDVLGGWCGRVVSRSLLYNGRRFRPLVCSCPSIASLSSKTCPLRSVLGDMRFLSGIVSVLSSVALLGYAYPSSIDVRGTGFVL